MADDDKVRAIAEALKPLARVAGRFSDGLPDSEPLILARRPGGDYEVVLTLGDARVARGAVRRLAGESGE